MSKIHENSLNHEAFSLWMAHRASIGHPLTHKQQLRHQRILLSMGEHQLKSVTYCTLKGYRGLFPHPDIRATLPGTFDPSEKWW